MTRNLYLFACGAGPAADIAELAKLAIDDGWDVYPGATPAGWQLLDVDGLTETTGHQPRHDYSGRTSEWPPADGIIVAAATLNTIGKLVAGIADTWVLGTITECMGLGVPIVIAPNVNPAMASHPRFARNIAELQTWGISVLWDEPTERPWMVPWTAMLEELNRLRQRQHG